MSQNPYGPGIGGGGASGAAASPFDDFAPKPRTSALAVSSLVFALICCIPGTGAIAAILGTAALMVIAKEEPRLTGRGMAIISIVLGLLVTMLWTGVILGAVNLFGSYERNMIRPTEATMTAIEAGDFNKARAMFDAKTSPLVTDEKLTAFRDAYRAEAGTFVGLPQGAMNFGSFVTGSGGSSGRTDVNFSDKQVPIGWIMEYSKQGAITFLVTDNPDVYPDALLHDKPINGVAVNIVIFTPGGKPIWLFPPSQPGGP